MDYYVIFHKDSGAFIGLSTFMPLDANVPDGFTFEPRMGDLPNDLSVWDCNGRNFVLPQKLVLTKLQFLERFTVEERVSIRNSTDPIIKDFLEMLNIAQDIDLSNDTLRQGLMYLVSVGNLALNRVDEILRAS
jgi:hypothetical protein